MDVTLEFLESLSASDLRAIDEGMKILDVAKHAVAMFRANCFFPIGENIIELKSKTGFSEFVVQPGLWQARTPSRSYEIRLDYDAVFEALKKRDKAPTYEQEFIGLFLDRIIAFEKATEKAEEKT